MWVTRREFDGHIADNTRSVNEFTRRLEHHDESQANQHAENRAAITEIRSSIADIYSLLWKVAIGIIGGLSLALYELFVKLSVHLHP